MIALDTNVLVRFLVESTDEPTQSERARTLVAESLAAGEEVLLPIVVVVETVWVLKSVARFGKPQLLAVVQDLLESGLTLDDGEIVREALETWRTGQGDFADYVIGAQARGRGAAQVYTFDTKLARSPGYTLL